MNEPNRLRDSAEPNKVSAERDAGTGQSTPVPNARAAYSGPPDEQRGVSGRGCFATFAGVILGVVVSSFTTFALFMLLAAVAPSLFTCDQGGTTRLLAVLIPWNALVAAAGVFVAARGPRWRSTGGRVAWVLSVMIYGTLGGLSLAALGCAL